MRCLASRSSAGQLQAEHCSGHPRCGCHAAQVATVGPGEASSDRQTKPGAGLIVRPSSRRVEPYQPVEDPFPVRGCNSWVLDHQNPRLRHLAILHRRA